MRVWLEAHLWHSLQEVTLVVIRPWKRFVYWGKKMTAEIKQRVRTCDVCQRVNDRFHKPPAQLHPIPVTPEVWNQVCYNGYDIYWVISGCYIVGEKTVLSLKFINHWYTAGWDRFDRSSACHQPWQ